MNKHVVVGAVVGLVAPIAVATSAAQASPASSDAGARGSAGCVTKPEFRRVRRGMSIRRVHRIFDTQGKQTYFLSGSQYWPAEQWREYRACRQPQYSYLQVDFKKRRGVWRVSGKTAYWG